MTSSILPSYLHSTSLKISCQTERCLDGTILCVHPKRLLNFPGKSGGVSEGKSQVASQSLLRWQQFLDISDIIITFKLFKLMLFKKFIHSFLNASYACFSLGVRCSINIELLKSCLIWLPSKILSLILASLKQGNLYF